MSGLLISSGKAKRWEQIFARSKCKPACRETLRVCNNRMPAAASREDSRATTFDVRVTFLFTAIGSHPLSVDLFEHVWNRMKITRFIAVPQSIDRSARALQNFDNPRRIQCYKTSRRRSSADGGVRSETSVLFSSPRGFQCREGTSSSL